LLQAQVNQVLLFLAFMRKLSPVEKGAAASEILNVKLHYQ
jgi:hypothetical protein